MLPRSFPASFLRRTAAALFLLALLPDSAALAQFAPIEASKNPRGIRRTFDNYDVRVTDPGETAAKDSLRATYRARQLPPARAAAVEALAGGMAAARASLAARIPSLQVEMNLAGRVPEVVGVSGGKDFLTAPSSAARESVARDFLTREAAVYGLTTAEVAALVKFTDYANPAGNMSWVEFRQHVMGIPVFQGELRAGFTAKGALARTTGNLVPGIDATTLSAKPALNPAEAAAKAAATVNVFADPAHLKVTRTEQDGRVNILAGGPFDQETRAELVWFPVEPGVAVLAWSMVLWRPLASYYILVDANDGTLLWRKNITQFQTQPVTYSVYTSDSPAPLSPTTAVPGSGLQAPAVPRTLVTIIADDLNASPLGWITDGNNTTLGNNVTAGLDITSPDGVDANVTGSGTRVFDFPYNPPPGVSGGTGSGTPTDANFRNGVVTNLFFWTNRYHDRLWQVGFTEQAANFQTNNFGRGGLGGDAVLAQAQDFAGTNNANFATPPDGTPGRMRMYLFTAPSPQRDGSLDADVFLHEMTHGTSTRLHGNASGLATQASGGMGEGWSDFYARCILATPDENVNAVFASGAYVTIGLGSIGTDNYYYGIRRFPYAVKATVGPNGKPHNPLTLADIDNAKINLTDGAYPASPTFAANPANEVHNVGEVWCMMLLEFRARLINRLGFATGNQRALQIVTDAMKLDPVSPNLVQGRDSLIAAAYSGPNGSADAADVLAAFALRGAGTGATSTNPGSGVITVTESFTAGVFAGPVSSSDTPGNNNGVPEPGEILAITVPLTNPGATTVSPVSVTINGSTSTISLAAGASAPVTINYQIPAGTACGASITLSVGISAGGNNSTLSYSFRVGTIIASTVIQTFDGVTPPALPSGWTTTTAAAAGGLAGTPWATSTNGQVDGLNSAFSPGLPGTATAGGEAVLISPAIPVPAGGANLSFRHRWSFEVTSGVAYDGGVLEIAIPGVAGGAFRDILAAGGSFLQGGYTGTLGSTATVNPIGGRQAFTGNSGVITTLVALPAAANGQSVQFRWRLGFDDGTASGGWYVDTVSFGAFACAPANDADGDGLPDAYELANGLNPNNPADAALDSDGDGMTNLEEFKAGTDPRNPASVLRASVVRTTDGSLIVSFPSLSSHTYTVEYKDDLTVAGWSQLRSGLVGTGGTLSVTDTAPPSATGRRVYRARIITP